MTVAGEILSCAATRARWNMPASRSSTSSRRWPTIYRSPTTSRLAARKRAAARRRRAFAVQALALLGATLNVDRPVGSLEFGEKQLVDLARALSTQLRVLFLDEPTGALGQHEADRLHNPCASWRLMAVASSTSRTACATY